MWKAEPFWGWLHIFSDLTIYASYTAIPAILIYVIRRKSDLPFNKLFWLFASFILACGTTHLLDAVIFYWPVYKAAGVAKLITAVVSALTVVAAVRVLPTAMSLRSHSFLEHLLLQREKDFEKVSLQNAEMQASIALQAEKLRIANEAAGLMPWTWNLHTDEVELPKSLREMLGLGDQPKAADFIAMVEESDRGRLLQALQNSIYEDKEYNEEFRMRDKNGATRWIAGRGRIVERIDGQPVTMAGVNYDVTLHRQIQDRMATVERALSSTTSGVAILDVTDAMGKIVWSNRALNMLMGLSEKSLHSQTIESFFKKLTDQNTVQKILTAVHEREEGCFKVLMNGKLDKPVWVEVTLSTVQGDRFQIPHMIAVFDDISESIEHEEELRLAKQQAEQANNAKSIFLANMSHEIRTPLTAILGCADALYPILNTDGQKEFLQIIRGQGRLLLGILNDVLDFSKIEAGKLDIAHESCSVVQIVQEVVSLMQPSAVEKGISIRLSYTSKLPSTIESDPVRIRQILLNLLSNAVKFTPGGTVHVGCSCIKDGDQWMLYIAVEDPGIGISAEELEKIFQAFAQSSTSQHLGVGGTGLGLTIAQRLADLLGGRIRVRSQLNRGSTFTFELPLSHDVEPTFIDVSQRAAMSDEQKETNLPFKLTSILVVEDTRSIQFMLTKMLEPFANEIVVVNNGVEALELIHFRSDFDVVLMDMQMPLMNGYDAARQLRTQGITIPIVALTAGALAGDRERCIVAGCNEYVSKPVEFDKLVMAISRCIRDCAM